MNITQRKITEYEKLKSEIEALEARAKRLRDEIVAHVEREGGRSEVGVYELKLTMCERQNFDLKSAVVGLGEEVLKPFIKITEYPRLQVKRRVA
jgi:deoxyxylulose-5-phosphate synthase